MLTLIHQELFAHAEEGIHYLGKTRLERAHRLKLSAVIYPSEKKTGENFQ